MKSYKTINLQTQGSKERLNFLLSQGYKLINSSKNIALLEAKKDLKPKSRHSIR